VSKATTNATSALAGALQRAPTREEVDLKVAEAQRKLGDLKRAQETWNASGRPSRNYAVARVNSIPDGEEMIHHLTRGLGLLEDGRIQFPSRRRANGQKRWRIWREALAKVEAVHEETWTQGQLQRGTDPGAHAPVENARMEWTARAAEIPCFPASRRTLASKLVENHRSRVCWRPEFRPNCARWGWR